MIIDEDVVADYKENDSLHKLAKKYHTHYTNIKLILIKNGVKINEVQKSKTAEHADEILALYKSGVDSNEIAKKFGVSGQNLRKFLKRHVELRKRQEYCKQYPINIEPFKDPSNEITAYWLGFLMADGHIRKYAKNKSIKIACKLQARDIGHLWNFTKDLSTTKQPKLVNSKTPRGKKIKAAFINISNQELYEILVSYGMKDFKGKGIIRLPKNLNMRHWLRGLIDGDGIISTADKGRYLRLGFISPHRNICVLIRKLLGEETTAKKFNKIARRMHNKEMTVTKPVYTTEWCGFAAVEIARYLYCNSTRYLQRKWDKVMPFINKQEKQEIRQITGDT